MALFKLNQTSLAHLQIYVKGFCTTHAYSYFIFFIHLTFRTTNICSVLLPIQIKPHLKGNCSAIQFFSSKNQLYFSVSRKSVKFWQRKRHFSGAESNSTSFALRTSLIYSLCKHATNPEVFSLIQDPIGTFYKITSCTHRVNEGAS